MKGVVRGAARARRYGAGLVAVLAGGWLLVACQDAAPVDSSSSTRPPVTLTASVDKAVATTGDVIRYEVTLEHDPDIEVSLPEIFSKIQGFKVSDIEHEGPVERDGRQVESRVFQLRAFDTGSYVLPALSVTYTDPNGKEQTAGTPQIFVEIQSVLDKGEEQEDIADIKPAQAPPRDYRPLLLVGAAVLLLGGLVGAVVWYLRRRRDREEAAPPPRPPWEEAMQALDALEKGDILDREDHRAYGFALSEIFRTYLERRFSFPALENTTEEILSAFRRVDVPLGKPRDLAHQVLTATDRLKFAKGSLSAEEAERLLDAAREFVAATTPPPPVEEGDEARVSEGGRP